ncbi:response regulator [Pseudooctadecabacter sp.]|uniref:response regulator n=1 Tax=Pseudooctadecabacter sp. TaxID=1966338 RepID=UPI0035C7956F
MFQDSTILYLEDEPLIAMDTGDHLEDLGFARVNIAYRLAAAEKLVAELDFDFALLDINVDGGQNSLDLGRTLAERGTAVIFASGNSGAGRDLRAEGYSFLDKPFALAALTDHLAEMLSFQKERRTGS